MCRETPWHSGRQPNEEPLERTRKDIGSGRRSGVNGTPTFFIKGVRYDGSRDESDLLAAVEAAAA
jgi:protein-disulfide isomerase